MEITFEGGEADQHGVDLYLGGESISGLGRTATLIAHYSVTGEVRYRAPYSSRYRFQIAGTREGSLVFLIEEVARIASAAQAASVRAINSKLLDRVVRRAIGRATESGLRTDSGVIPSGDIDALAEAVTPALTRAHRWIEVPHQRIVLTPSQESSIPFDSATKSYLTAEEPDPNEDVQDVSVGALNVNSRNGRVFFGDLGRTVPFIVPKNATGRTIPTLSRYLTQYAERTGATVNIRFRRIRYPDGRLKRIVVSDCYAIVGEA